MSVIKNVTGSNRSEETPPKKSNPPQQNKPKFGNKGPNWKSGPPKGGNKPNHFKGGKPAPKPKKKQNDSDSDDDDDEDSNFDDDDLDGSDGSFDSDDLSGDSGSDSRPSSSGKKGGKKPTPNKNKGGKNDQKGKPQNQQQNKKPEQKNTPNPPKNTPRSPPNQVTSAPLSTNQNQQNVANQNNTSPPSKYGLSSGAARDFTGFKPATTAVTVTHLDHANMQKEIQTMKTDMASLHRKLDSLLERNGETEDPKRQRMSDPGTSAQQKSDKPGQDGTSQINANNARSSTGNDSRSQKNQPGGPKNNKQVLLDTPNVDNKKQHSRNASENRQSTVQSNSKNPAPLMSDVEMLTSEK